MKNRQVKRFAAVAGVALITFAGVQAIPVNATTAGFVYLLYVLVIASTWGFVEAALASVAATLVFNFFFLPPVGTLTIADPQNWVALFAFLTTSLIASRLSTIARQRAADAIERQQDVERLYTFGRAILLIQPNEPFARQLAHRLAQAFSLNAVALYESRTGETHYAGPADMPGIEGPLKAAAIEGTVSVDAQQRRFITAVRLGAEPIAGLAVQGERMSDSVLQSITNLVAIGLERARAQELVHEVEAARRSERLRTTLIDAMAHELKTPLTSIRAATTALLSNLDHPPVNAARILQIADEEAAHLEEIIDNTLDVAHLGSDRIDLNLEARDLEDCVGAVITSAKNRYGERDIRFSQEKGMHPVVLDPHLIKLALKQILDNAVKYSPSGTPIDVGLSHTNETVTVAVTDYGKGVPEQEQRKVFERFFRSPSVADRIPGSGLGLSIAQRIVQAHGGDITLNVGSGKTTFALTLPTRLPAGAPH